jgi:hypothetical protein
MIAHLSMSGRRGETSYSSISVPLRTFPTQTAAFSAARSLEKSHSITFVRGLSSFSLPTLQLILYPSIKSGMSHVERKLVQAIEGAEFAKRDWNNRTAGDHAYDGLWLLVTESEFEKESAYIA